MSPDSRGKMQLKAADSRQIPAFIKGRKDQSGQFLRPKRTDLPELQIVKPHTHDASSLFRHRHELAKSPPDQNVEFNFGRPFRTVRPKPEPCKIPLTVSIRAEFLRECCQTGIVFVEFDDTGGESSGKSQAEFPVVLGIHFESTKAAKLLQSNFIRTAGAITFQNPAGRIPDAPAVMRCRTARSQ